MKTNLFFARALCLFALLLTNCEPADIDLKKGSSSEKFPDLGVSSNISADSDYKVITFDTDDLSAGDIIDAVNSSDGTSSVKVEGFNPRFGQGTNAAMIFDTDNPTVGDYDLGTPNEDFEGPGQGAGGEEGSPYQNDVTLNNVLIVSEDLDTSKPDDEARYEGSQLIFDFSELYNEYNSVSLKSIDILDVEESETGSGAFVKVFDVNGDLLENILLPATGDNGYARIDLKFVPFAYKVAVEFLGSGAMDNLTFVTKTASCTRTLGFYKNHLNAWCTIDPETAFFMSDVSYLEAITTQPKGDPYFILSQQYVAAILNICNGAKAPGEVQKGIEEAQELFETYTPGTVPKNMKSRFTSLATTLDNYNNGAIGPGHCD